MRILLITVYLLSIASISYADLFVIYDTKTKEVLTASERDDTIAPKGYKQETIEGNLSDFTENPTNYKFNNGKFIKNIDKIDKAERARLESEDALEVEALIQEKMREQAIEELKTEGKLDAKGKLVK